MRYCKKCLQPDTRPGIQFDEDHICYACRYEEEKSKIDWQSRWQELVSLADQAKKQRGNYDCVIGVSGGKDSTFQSIIAREKLGLHPLLVNYVPDNITPVGQHNINNLSHLGFDIIRIRIDPCIERKLAKRGFITQGNIYVYAEHSLWSSAFNIADKFNIPLIIEGENPALTLGTCLHTDTSGSAFNIASFNTLTGSPLDDLPQEEFPPEKLYFYKMPPMESLKAKGIVAVWLQYYMREWSQVGNADFAVARGLHGRMTEDLHDLGRYRRFTALDSDFVIVNQMLKYFKFGFGFATDEACYDIREGRLTREDAIWYVKEYDGKCGDQYINAFCEYIDIPLTDFWKVVDKYVNKNLFYKDAKHGWLPKFTVGEDFEPRQ